MTDLISRQAAIDAIESHIRTAEEPYQLSQTEKALNHAFEIAASCVYNLPSVQTHSEGLYIDGRNEGYREGWKDGREALRREIWEDGRERDRLD